MYRSSIYFAIIFSYQRRNIQYMKKEKCNLAPVSFTGAYIDIKCKNIP